MREPCPRGRAEAVEPRPLTGPTRGRQPPAASAGEGLAGAGAPSLGSRASQCHSHRAALKGRNDIGVNLQQASLKK